MNQRLILLFCALACSVAFVGKASAGVSAENVVVIVNADSADSRTVANHYVNLRNIPSSNVVFLKDVPDGLKISLEDFRTKILLPLLQEINARQIAAQTRVIAYSVGFPTSVDISEHTTRLTDPNQKQYQRPTASINGLTYFYQFVIADREVYLDWNSNLYARGTFERHFANPFLDVGTRERFDVASGAFTDEKFEEAAKAFEQLFSEAPSLSPLAIRAAEARAKTDDREAAILLISQAIAAGWTSGTYLQQNETLAPLLEDPRLARMSPVLDDAPTVAQQPIGFAANVGWTPSGHPMPDSTAGIPYLMSCLLGVVHPRGSTIDQAIAVLDRAATGDFTHPDAPFWFSKTSDVRTTTRFPGIASVLLWLAHLEKEFEVFPTAMPDGKSAACAGLMLGTATMPLANRTWSFAPGALAENLTSTSAHFGVGGQTKITELLHAGAAISSGAVDEPFSLQAKFPLPMMYGYYASGVSAIEAFYLSVSSPYQLLIVGDPLAQPFATPPNDWVAARIQPGQSANQQQLQLTRNPISVTGSNTPVGAIEIYLDGKMVQRVPAARNVNLNLPAELSGQYQLRTVLVGAPEIRPRASHAEWVTFTGKLPTPETEVDAEAGTVALKCVGADAIELLHHQESLGSVAGQSGSIDLDIDELGRGPIRLRAVATFGNQRVPAKAIVVTADTR